MRSGYFFPRVLDTKIQRGRIFTRTDLSFITPNKQFVVASSVFAFLQIIIEKRVLMRSRYFFPRVLDTKI
jgi:hypothetical protein